MQNHQNHTIGVQYVIHVDVFCSYPEQWKHCPKLTQLFYFTSWYTHIPPMPFVPVASR